MLASLPSLSISISFSLLFPVALNDYEDKQRENIKRDELQDN